MELNGAPFTAPRVVRTFDASTFLSNARKWCDLSRDIVRATFEAVGTVPLTFFVFATRVPGLKASVILETHLREEVDYTPEAKMWMASFVEVIARDTDALGVTWSSESWMNSMPAGAEFEAYRRELSAWQDAHDGSIAGHRGTHEAVVFTFECDRFAAMSSAPILEQTDPITGELTRSLGPWVDQPLRRTEGRFSRVFKSAEERTS